MRGTKKNVWAAILIATFLMAATPVAAFERTPERADVMTSFDLGFILDLVLEWLPTKGKPKSSEDTTSSTNEPATIEPTEEFFPGQDPLG